jgi:hypothetical protein
VFECITLNCSTLEGKGTHHLISTGPLTNHLTQATINTICRHDDQSDKHVITVTLITNTELILFLCQNVTEALNLMY